MMEAKGVLMNSPKYWFLILFLLILGCAAKQSTAPIYDEKADARRDIAAAIAKAEGSKRNIVLIFGANW
jgi:protein disulfide-isomerase